MRGGGGAIGANEINRFNVDVLARHFGVRSIFFNNNETYRYESHVLCRTQQPKCRNADIRQQAPAISAVVKQVTSVHDSCDLLCQEAFFIIAGLCV